MPGKSKEIVARIKDFEYIFRLSILNTPNEVEVYFLDVPVGYYSYANFYKDIIDCKSSSTESTNIDIKFSFKHGEFYKDDLKKDKLIKVCRLKKITKEEIYNIYNYLIFKQKLIDKLSEKISNNPSLSEVDINSIFLEFNLQNKISEKDQKAKNSLYQEVKSINFVMSHYLMSDKLKLTHDGLKSIKSSLEIAALLKRTNLDKSQEGQKLLSEEYNSNSPAFNRFIRLFLETFFFFRK
jgi:hypothetical protein